MLFSSLLILLLLRFACCRELLETCTPNIIKDEVAQKILHVHNLLRSKHSSPPLNKSIILTKMAQEWADTLASEGRLHQRPNITYGQNLYKTKDPKFDPRIVVASWYKKATDYDFSNKTAELFDRRFPQVLWMSTRMIGVGYAHTYDKESQQKTHYVVTHYHPKAFQEDSTKNLKPRLHKSKKE